MTIGADGRAAPPWVRAGIDTVRTGLYPRWRWFASGRPDDLMRVHFKLGADRATASRCNDCKVHLRGLRPETEMHPPDEAHPGGRSLSRSAAFPVFIRLAKAWFVGLKFQRLVVSLQHFAIRRSQPGKRSSQIIIAPSVAHVVVR